MANRFLNNIKINDSYTLPPADGTANQIIQTNGAGELSFIDPSAISVGESEQVHIACKNTSGVAISKGDPVYITGTVGTSFIIQIAKADASDSAKMPAVGLAETDLGLNAEGFVIVSGVLKNLTTDPLSTSDGTPSSNDTVYVKAGGGLTRTKPTGSGNLIQNVGKVGRVNSANAGSLAVSTIMRTNDVPNLTTGKIWVGSSTYTTESTVVHLDETNGRMGIGTTSPGYKLDVNGGAQFNTNTGATPFYITRLGSATEALSIKVTDQHVRFESIQDEAADSYGGFDFRMDGGVTEPNFVIRKNTDDPILHVDGAGKVGIGTTSPSEKLDVVGGPLKVSDTYATVKIIGTGGLSRVFLGDTADEDVGYLEYNHISNYFRIGVNAAEIMRIDSSGRVGIGTTSPSYKLHATGGALVGGKVSYLKSYSFLDTTGNAVAGITTGGNGGACNFTFTCSGHTGGYQKIVYSCHNAVGTWNTTKVIDEGTNDFDVEASANGTTITFTFKSTSGTKSYSPKVLVEAFGTAINSTYA